VGQARNNAPEVDPTKMKSKGIFGHIQQENIPQNAKDGQDKHI